MDFWHYQSCLRIWNSSRPARSLILEPWVLKAMMNCNVICPNIVWIAFFMTWSTMNVWWPKQWSITQVIWCHVSYSETTKQFDFHVYWNLHPQNWLTIAEIIKTPHVITILCRVLPFSVTKRPCIIAYLN